MLFLGSPKERQFRFFVVSLKYDLESNSQPTVALIPLALGICRFMAPHSYILRRPCLTLDFGSTRVSFEALYYRFYFATI